MPKRLNLRALPRGKFTSAIERDIAHGRGHSEDLINGLLEMIHVVILARGGSIRVYCLGSLVFGKLPREPRPQTPVLNP